MTEADFQDAQLPGLIVRGSDLRGASLASRLGISVRDAQEDTPHA